MKPHIVGILSELGFLFMAMAAGAFAIVGTLIAASGKTYRRTRLLVCALVLFTFSAIAGYLFEGILVSALYANESSPFSWKITLFGIIQLILFVTASTLLICFYVANINVKDKRPNIE